jgi:hypothetical protein
MACDRCECCKGRGKVVGLGCMERECNTCAGVGYIAVVGEPVIEGPLVKKSIVKQNKKKSWPKKEKSLSGDQASILKN